MAVAGADINMLEVYTANFSPSKQPQAFPLQGSKRGQVPVINRLIPEGKPRLIEPFCGSAAMSIGARHGQRVGDVFISDANKSLVQLWEALLSSPEELANGYEAVWGKQFESGVNLDSREYFNQVRDRYNDSVSGDPADFLFLLNRIVKAALRYGKNGKMNQSADGRRVGARPSVVRSRIMATHNLLQGAQVKLCDWREAIEQATESDVIYLDPPYQGTTDTRDRRYISGMSVETFEEGVRDDVEKGLSLIISYDALRGPAIYGRPLDPSLKLLPLDVITGVSAQGTLLGRKQESHETIYLSPALVERLGGVHGVEEKISNGQEAIIGLQLDV